jgi:hypothetical protein
MIEQERLLLTSYSDLGSAFRKNAKKPRTIPEGGASPAHRCGIRTRPA